MALARIQWLWFKVNFDSLFRHGRSPPWRQNLLHSLIDCNGFPGLTFINLRSAKFSRTGLFHILSALWFLILWVAHALIKSTLPAKGATIGIGSYFENRTVLGNICIYIYRTVLFHLSFSLSRTGLF